METAVQKALDIQASLLGCILADPACTAEMAEKVSEDMFLSIPDRLMWNCLLRLNDQGLQKFDLIAVRDEMGTDWQTLGGVDYFKRIDNLEYNGFNADRYATSMIEFYRKTKLAEMGREVVGIIDSDKTSDEMVADIEQAMASLNNTSRETGIQHAKDIECSFEADDNEFIKTQFSELNDQIIGLGNSQLIIVMGSTSMGKTSLMLDFFRHIAYQNSIPSAFFSCEMSNKQNKERMSCTLSEISLKAAKTGYISQVQRELLYEAARQLGDKPMYFDKTPSLTPLTLRRKLARSCRVHGTKIAFVDHMHRMKSSRRIDSRRQELASIANDVHDIAVDLDIPIVIGAQVNRKCAERDNKRPGLHDIRDCGEIEEQADTVINVYRPSYYEEEGLDELRVLKGRNCGTGAIFTEFIGNITSFRPL